MWIPFLRPFPRNEAHKLFSGAQSGGFFGKGQKGPHKRGIHDQGDFWKFPLETTVEFALKSGKFGIFMDTPFVDTPFGPPRVLGGVQKI